jgi:hypothetical protein
MTKSKIQSKELKRQNTLLKNQITEFKQREEFTQGIKLESLESLDSYSIVSNPKLKEEVIAISTISDVHIEEEVTKAIVNNLNEYNLDVAKKRIELYFKRLMYMIIQTRKSGFKVDNLVLGLLGDFITGYIHEELEETNALTPIQASLCVQELLIKGIKTLAEQGDLKSIKIPCIPGNHGRTTKRKRFTSGYKNSYEWLMYHNMKNLFDAVGGYNNVEFLIPESEFIYLNLFGYINKFSHGDHFNYQGGIGGIEVPLKKWVLRENSVIKTDMSWIAHWHQYIVLNRARVNGSLIGYNSYARAFGFEPEPPKMQFQLLDKKRGYTLNNPIILTDF